jgi:TldD protein
MPKKRIDYKDLAEYSLTILNKLGAEYAEARLEEHKTNNFVLKNSHLDVAAFDHFVGLGLRYTAKKTLGFIAINRFNKEKIKELIKRSFKLTQKSAKIKEQVNFSKAKPIKTNHQVRQKINLNLEPNKKIKILTDIEKAILQTKTNLPNRFLSLNDDLLNKFYLNTEGTRINSIIPRVSLMYYITIKNSNQVAQRFWQYGAASGYEAYSQWKLEKELPREVKALSKSIKEGIKPPKVCDLVVAPEVTGIMVHESVGHPYEADRIFGREAAQAGESFVNKDMLGQKIGSSCVNVADDPTLPNSFGFYLYDDEGVNAGRKMLIKEGHINEFLHNRQTAHQMNMVSNGSARANNYDKEPIIRMSNTFLLPGKYKEEELFQDIKLGVYIKNFMEWNIDDKRVNQKYVGSEAYLIKNGKLTNQAVKKPAIEITTPKLWSSVDAVADNTEHHAGNCGKGEPMQGIPVWFGGPSFRLRKIRLG